MESGNTTKPTKHSGLFRRLSLLLTVTGALILLVGFGLSAKECWFHIRAVKTTGKATDSSGEMDPTSHEPSILYLIRFTAKDGRVFNFYEVVSGEPFADDAVLTVFYDPQNPRDARLTTPGRWDLPLKFLLAGSALGFCSFGTRRFTKGQAVSDPPYGPPAPAEQG